MERRLLGSAQRIPGAQGKGGRESPGSSSSALWSVLVVLEFQCEVAAAGVWWSPPCPGLLDPGAAVGDARGARRALMDKQENQGYSCSFFPSLLIFYASCPIICQASSAPRCLSAVEWKEA